MKNSAKHSQTCKQKMSVAIKQVKRYYYEKTRDIKATQPTLLNLGRKKAALADLPAPLRYKRKDYIMRMKIYHASAGLYITAENVILILCDL